MSKVTSAKTKGRLTKQELKQDKLVKLAYQVEQFYLEHQKWVWGFAIAIIVVIAGVVLVRKTSEGTRKEASYELTMAKTNFGMGQLDQAKAGFEKILETRSGIVAAEAKYFMGRVAFDQGNYTQAIDEFNAYLKDFAGNDELDAAALGGLAASYESLENYENAAKAYEQLANEYPENTFAPQALWEASRIYQKLNQMEKVPPLLRKIRDQYPESALTPQAKRQLETLE